MARILKCNWCKVSDTTKDEMEFETQYKQKKYYHKDCFKKHLEDREFKDKERNELDQLVDVIKEIYDVKIIPTVAFPLLQKIRNGEEIYGKRIKKTKEGYDFSLISEAYSHCSETIRYWNRKKEFSGFMQAFRYGLVIMSDKLPIIEKQRREQEMREEISKRRVYTKDQHHEDREYTFVGAKKSDEMDISDFL
ncbi:hypothetical protein [Thermoactinomyces sp. DSM 45892]|uniref:hypothetical protein n=1 Tax=Thermoactinomyces sp. DSM 45892 TaxID=1882753 RepID=UPI000895C170|nr:hypothetical protein [Thermoactinomyces sp. DSM 45892]SDX93859.1 hypothetical protein SAMN05444416_10156 [Thermoactinomyces sp. DSM 45892]